MDIESGHNTEVFQARPSQHYTLVFNAFVCMTLFNEINARKVHDEHNVFEGVHRNHLFMIIWVATFASQVCSVYILQLLHYSLFNLQYSTVRTCIFNLF